MSSPAQAFALLNRRTIRGPINPLDKSTIVSIYPKVVEAINITLTPGKWVIPAGSPESPAILVIGPSSWWKEIDLKEPLLEISQGSVQIADSIVKDYCNGVFGCDMGESQIGLFWVPGEMTIDKLRKEHKALLDKATERQKNYYRTLVKFADAIWAESNGNPMGINDEMRMACRLLGYSDRDWMKDYVTQGKVQCRACGAFKSPEFPVCPQCRAIDSAHPMAKDLKFAQ